MKISEAGKLQATFIFYVLSLCTVWAWSFINAVRSLGVMPEPIEMWGATACLVATVFFGGLAFLPERDS